jgi:hypothetical protein
MTNGTRRMYPMDSALSDASRLTHHAMYGSWGALAVGHSLRQATAGRCVQASNC